MASRPLNISCPNCLTLLQPTDAFCSGCGVDMATLTLVLTQSAAAEARARLAAQAPRIVAPRLGEFLVQRNLLTNDQLQQALRRQKELVARAENKMLGEILLTLGFISEADLKRAIVDHFVSLQTAMRESNRALSERVAERTAAAEKAVARVAEINQLKVNFISNISHELRTPLTHIQGYVAMLQEGYLGELNPQQNEVIYGAMRAVEQLGRLIEDLVRFTVAAQGEVIVTVGNFSLSDLAQTVIHRSLDKARKREVQLNFAVLPVSIEARGDEEKLSWVLLQLVDNAIKHTPEGGSVTLTLTSETERRGVTVAVQDTGVGISLERIQELFGPLPESQEAAPRRAGLGLAMVRRIIEAHGSEVKVESAAGRGSTFSFELPLAT